MVVAVVAVEAAVVVVVAVEVVSSYDLVVTVFYLKNCKKTIMPLAFNFFVKSVNLMFRVMNKSCIAKK